jgi:alpha-tubulin suppressor-like RCC1 family protein
VDVDAVHKFGPEPVPLPNGVALNSISTGESHICGVAADHQAYCWGDFEGGRRGDPLIGFDTSYATFQPNVVGGGLEFAEVRAGSVGTCGLTVGGQAYCWGSNAAGTLGDPAATVQQNCGLAPSPCAPAPVPVAGGHQFTALSGSRLHVCGVTPPAELYCWGSDVAHQIGAPDPRGLCAATPCEAAPAKVFATEATFATVSAGGLSTCGLTGDGIGYCWGDDSYGQLGIGGGPADLPVQVAGGHRFKAIAVAIDHACALSLDGDAFCWGENGDGQLGTGDQKDSNEPVAVVGLAAD